MMGLPKANQPLPVEGQKPQSRLQEPKPLQLQHVGIGISPTFYGMPAGGAVTTVSRPGDGS